MLQTKRALKLALTAVILTATLALGDGTRITPPKNNYSLADDVKVGQEAAAQVARELPLLPEDGDIDSYVEGVGRVLAAAIPPEFAHAEFRYEFSVVNAKDINAFALPGGPMFVNRGMIQAAKTEGEMAGVMAHELSHVALRHGTAQATKSQSAGIQLGAIGGAILGAIIGGDAGGIVAQGTQIGLGTYLLKFSREYETQADLLGAQILAKAGYDPMDLARMFQTIEQQGSASGPEWMSSHPNPGNRYQRISDESKKLTVAQPSRSNQSKEFSQVQSTLTRMAPAATSEEIAKSRRPDNSGRYPDDARMEDTVDPPSTRYRVLRLEQAFEVSVPENWKEFRDSSSVTLAPEGAYGNVKGQSVFTHGAIIGLSQASSRDLTRESDRLVSGILDGNAYLSVNGKYARLRIAGRDALRIRLVGNSPVTNRREIVDVYTVLARQDALFSIVQVVPGNDQASYRAAFDEMVRSVRFN
jgi:beta-barrel assembly-enhancing protease